jgi:hypothetical protein
MDDVKGNKHLNIISKFLFGILAFCLTVFGYILWFALKKHYPEQAKSCLIGSTVGSAMMVLAIVLVLVVPEDSAEKESITKTEKVAASDTRATERQPNTNRNAKTAEEEEAQENRIVTIIAVILLVVILILAIKKFGIGKVLGFFAVVVGILGLISRSTLGGGGPCRYCGRNYVQGARQRCKSPNNPEGWCKH